MPKPSKIMFACFAVFNLAGCELLDFNRQSARLTKDENGNFQPTPSQVLQQDKTKSEIALYSSHKHFLTINDYTRQLALEINSDLALQALTGSIIVAPFIYANDGFYQPDLLGRELALSLLNDLSDFGLPASDGILSDELNRTSSGAVAFPAAKQKMMTNLGVAYVTTGNMQRSGRGLSLTVKVVELQTGKVVASSRKFVPQAVISTM